MDRAHAEALMVALEEIDISCDAYERTDEVQGPDGSWVDGPSGKWAVAVPQYDGERTITEWPAWADRGIPVSSGDVAP